jgi:hypothetical protein
VLKYKLKIKDIKLEDFRVYLFALFKGILPKKKIRNIEDLTLFMGIPGYFIQLFKNKNGYKVGIAL